MQLTYFARIVDTVINRQSGRETTVSHGRPKLPAASRRDDVIMELYLKLLQLNKILTVGGNKICASPIDDEMQHTWLVRSRGHRTTPHRSLQTTTTDRPV